MKQNVLYPQPVAQVAHKIIKFNPATQPETSKRSGSKPARSHPSASRKFSAPPTPRLAPDGEPWCDRCRNIRWLVQTDPDGPPGQNKLVPCPACGVVAKRAIARFKRYSSLNGRAQRQKFNNFSLEGSAREATEAFNAALLFAKDPQGWLVLCGPNGNGKSHLAAAIANYLMNEKAIPTLFLTVPDFLESLRETFRSNGDGVNEYGPRFRAAREAPVLILDDLGAEKRTGWAQEILFLILDYRYRMELPTVVITNLALESLPPRIGSRLADRRFSKVVFNPATDYRLHGGNGQC